MASPSVHEALVYLMVVTSAADREMTDSELARIGAVVQTWPVFVDFDSNDLIQVAQDCQELLQEEGGLDGMLETSCRVIPQRLHDTAYAAAVEVAAVDLEMRMEEVRVLDRLRSALTISEPIAEAIEFAAKARHRMLT